MKATGKIFIDEKYKDQIRAFGFFLIKENLEAIRPLYPERFWTDYEANIEGMAYFSCPIIYPDYFKDGNLIRTFISVDEFAEGEDYFPSVMWWFKLNRDGTFERLAPQAVKKQDDDLICVCGNTPTQAGFYPCSEIGSEVDLTRQAGKFDLYACDRCGRIIHNDALLVQGFRQPNYSRLK